MNLSEKAAAGLQDLVNQSKPVETTAAAQPAAEAVVEKVEAPVEEQVQRNAEAPATQLIEWDKDEVKEVPSKFDLRELAKKVGIEAENEDDFVSKLQAQKQADPYEGLPDNLKKAVEYAKKGVDPLQLLKINSVDYSAIDPVQLFEADFIAKNGNSDDTEVALDSMNVYQKNYMGMQLRSQLEAQQKAAEQDLMFQVEQSKRKAQQEKEQFENQLRSELSKVEAVENFKVLEKHRKSLYQDIAQRGLDPRYKTANGYDFQRHIRDQFITSNWDALKTHLESRTKTATIKEELRQVQNVQLERNTERLGVEPSAESIHDKLNKQARQRIKAE